MEQLQILSQVTDKSKKSGEKNVAVLPKSVEIKPKESKALLQEIRTSFL